MGLVPALLVAVHVGGALALSNGVADLAVFRGALALGHSGALLLVPGAALLLVGSVALLLIARGTLLLRHGETLLVGHLLHHGNLDIHALLAGLVVALAVVLHGAGLLGLQVHNGVVDNLAHLLRLVPTL